MVPFADFDGLFVGWFPSALLLEVRSSRNAHSLGLLEARHLTRSVAVPADAAFTGCDSWGNVHGQHTGSFLPFGLWLTTVPCRVNTYYSDLSGKACDPSVL